MQDKKQKLDDEVLNKLIDAAYKDAGLINRLKIYFLAKKDSEVQRIYNEYRSIASSVKKISLDEIPDSAIKSIKIKTEEVRRSFILKPAYVIAFSLMIIGAFVAVLIYQNKEKEPVYSAAEIELAEKQVKESLSIVNRVFKKTEDLIQEEIFPKRVGKPVHKSLSIINEVLIGG